MRIATALRRGAASIEDRGVVASARLAWGDLRFLLRHGPSTFGTHPSAAAGRHRDALPSEPARAAVVADALDRLPEATKGGVLADVGCGRGHLLLAALDAGWTRLVGVELDPSLARDARRALGDRAQIVTADAATWPVPDEVTVVCLANPFGSATLADLLQELSSSLARSPRPLSIVYVNPARLAQVEAVGFHVRWRTADVAVLDSVPGDEGPT